MQQQQSDDPELHNLNYLGLLGSGKCTPSSPSINRLFKLDGRVKNGVSRRRLPGACRAGPRCRVAQFPPGRPRIARRAARSGPSPRGRPAPVSRSTFLVDSAAPMTISAEWTRSWNRSAPCTAGLGGAAAPCRAEPPAVWFARSDRRRRWTMSLLPLASRPAARRLRPAPRAARQVFGVLV